MEKDKKGAKGAKLTTRRISDDEEIEQTSLKSERLKKGRKGKQRDDLSDEGDDTNSINNLNNANNRKTNRKAGKNRDRDSASEDEMLKSESMKTSGKKNKLNDSSLPDTRQQVKVNKNQKKKKKKSKDDDDDDDDKDDDHSDGGDDDDNVAVAHSNKKKVGVSSAFAMLQVDSGGESNKSDKSDDDDDGGGDGDDDDDDDDEDDKTTKETPPASLHQPSTKTTTTPAPATTDNKQQQQHQQQQQKQQQKQKQQQTKKQNKKSKKKNDEDNNDDDEEDFDAILAQFADKTQLNANANEAAASSAAASSLSAADKKREKKMRKKGKLVTNDDVEQGTNDASEPSSTVDDEIKNDRQLQPQQLQPQQQPQQIQPPQQPQIEITSNMTADEIAKLLEAAATDDDEEEDKKKKKKNKQQAAKQQQQQQQAATKQRTNDEEDEEEGSDGDDDDDDDGGEGGGTVKTAAQKKKEKKEKQKMDRLKKLEKQKEKPKQQQQPPQQQPPAQQQQQPSQQPPQQPPQQQQQPPQQPPTITNEPAKEIKQDNVAVEAKDEKAKSGLEPETESGLDVEAKSGLEMKTDDGSTAMEDDAASKKSSKQQQQQKDKKKKKGADDNKEKDKKPSKMVKEILEAQKLLKAEEERLKREEEERVRKEEEAIRLKEEKERLERERKERRKQKEKERIQRLKAEGKFLTDKQKEDRKKAQQLLEAMRAKGVEVPTIGGGSGGGTAAATAGEAEKPKRVIYSSKPKKKQQQQQQQQQNNPDAATALETTTADATPQLDLKTETAEKPDNGNNGDSSPVLEIPNGENSTSELPDNLPQPPQPIVEDVKENWDESSSEDDDDDAEEDDDDDNEDGCGGENGESNKKVVGSNGVPAAKVVATTATTATTAATATTTTVVKEKTPPAAAATTTRHHHHHHHHPHHHHPPHHHQQQQQQRKNSQSHNSTTGDDDDDDDDEEDDDDESSDDDDDHRTAQEKARDKALARIKQRKETADSKKNTDTLRAPVVCVLGHVDTGKTKILDKLRRTNVQDGEAGGITQQIGATNVPHEALKEQTKMCKDLQVKIPGLLIIDTPGHESFSNLRTRGSSLCDIAILVVDIMHGLEPQTIESINILKQRKTPFVVALNKIDRLFGWITNPHSDVTNLLKKQKQNTKMEFDERTSQVVVQFAEQGLNARLFYENKNPREYISLVPTSAMTGDGIGNLITLICDLTQTLLVKRLMFTEELQATVMEVKAIPGHGTTIDVILVNGRLKTGSTIIVAGQDGPIVTQIRSLLMPQPMHELRVKSQFESHKEVLAAQGCKIAAKDLEKALAGLPLYVADQSDEVDIYKEELSQMLKDVLSDVKVSDKGVYVQASTLGSLEALLTFLKTSEIPYAGINIGPVHKRDIMKASVMLEHDPQFACILAFDVKIERDAQEMADSMGIRIFAADIIYHLFDRFIAYRDEFKKQKREEFKHIAVFPCKLRILPEHIFNTRDPIVVGVTVEAGFIKEGTVLCVPSKEFIDIGRVSSIEVNHKIIEKATKGQEVCLKIDSIPGEAPKLYGRHFDHTDLLVSKISRQSIDVVKNWFREEMSKSDWQLIMELKKVFEII